VRTLWHVRLGLDEVGARRAHISLITLLTIAITVGSILYGPNAENAASSTESRIELSSISSSTVSSMWGESVHDELVRLQRQFGLTLVTIQGNNEEFADFAKRSLLRVRAFPHGTGWISGDGSEVATAIGQATNWHLGILRPDGTGLREYPRVVGLGDFCWSHDGSKLAFLAVVPTDRRHEPPRLSILNLNSGVSEDTEAVGHLTTQCWSPDDKQIVYTDANVAFEQDSRVRVFDLAARTSRTLASGINATWSPDGTWISYYEHDAYYAIRPAGADRKRLFKKWHATSGLLWSPDGRMAAFSSQAGLFEGQLPTIDVEVYWLRARRLSDGSETRVVGSYGDGNYQWLSSPEFIPK